MQRTNSLEKTLMLGKTEDRRQGDDRGWGGWMASLTLWTWVWVNSGSWWWTGRPGVQRFMGLQKVGHDWVTELNWTVYSCHLFKYLLFLLDPYCFCPLLCPSLHEMLPRYHFSWKIFSLSHSIVFLYLFALITEEGFLISPCYSLALCISDGYIFPFLLFF